MMLIDLNLDMIQQTKIESKLIIKNYVRYSFDLENHIFQKLNDKPIKILIAIFLLNTTDYLILGTNKGVVITKLDNSNPTAIVPSNKLIEINETKYFFYSLFNNSLIEDMYIEKDANSKQSHTRITSLINSSVFDIPKNQKGVMYHRFKINFSFNSEYLSCLDSFNETYSIFKVEINESLHHLFKNMKYGKGVQLEWCPYSPIFAVMTINTFVNKGDKANQNSSSFVSFSSGGNCSFTLTVFSILNDKITQLYEINNLASHLLYGGHFLGCIVSQPSIEGKELPLQINNSFSYPFNMKTELIFYSWNEKSKLNITLSEEPTHIVSSANLEFMVISFSEKYAIYKLNIETNAMEMFSMHWYQIIDCIIYENFILIYLTNNGLYFQILTEENGYPFKLLKFSNEMNHYHLKLSKKYKEKEMLYHKNHFQQKILGIFNNKLMTCNAFGDVTIRDIDHILFKITFLLQKNNLAECSLLLTMLEKKYIKSVLATFKYFFNNDEEVLRKIFTAEMVEHFQLYKYLKCFMKDLLKVPKSFANKNTEEILKEQLIKGIINKEEKKIQGLYHICSENQGEFGCLFAKYIDQNNYFKSLLMKERYFESYVFNSNYALNDMNPKILNKAFERLNQYQK